MPLDQSTCVLPLKILAAQTLSVVRARSTDFDFLKAVTENTSAPEFAGYNTLQARQHGQAVKPANKTLYRPLIDMTPSDPTTMMTAIVEAQTFARQSNQAFTVFTADQQLYRVMLNVIWMHPDMFSDFIPRLGGMHMIMSYVGCVGVLMANTGLDKVMKADFVGVSQMLVGKKIPPKLETS